MVGEDGGVLNGEVVSVEVGGVAATGVAALCGGVAGGPGGDPGAGGTAAETEAKVPAASDVKTWALVVRVRCLPLDPAAALASLPVTAPAASPPPS